MIAPLDVQLDGRVLHALLCDDVDDAANGVRAVLGARRAANDFDALDVLRADAQKLVAVAVVLRLAAQDALTVHHQQRMARVAATDRHADVAHRVDRARDADLVEDHIFDGLRLLPRDILLRDDRRRLRLVLRLFLCRICLNVYGIRLNL